MSEHNNGVHPSKILVVDDAPINIKLMSDMLSKAGYQIVPETNSRQALIDAQQESPDLILLDIMMPGLDGYEVCRQLKSHENTRDIPVIFMSALTQTNDKLKGFEAGGVDYVTRPFKQKEILARVEIHLALRQAQQALEQKNRQLSQEIARREETEAALRRHQAELAQANQQLQAEIYQHQQTAQALQQAHDQMKQRADELETLNQIAQTVATSTNLTSVLNAVAKTINQLFKASSTGIGLLNPNQTEITSVAEDSRHPNTPSALGMTIPISGTSATAQIMKTAQSIIIEQPQTDPRTTSIHTLMEARGSQGLMLSPLLARGNVIGIIAVDTVVSDRKFTSTELNLLETIAGQIAGAIENARLFDEERQQRQIAEQQNQELDAFAQTVAHDIKNPLSVVFTQADFMNTFIDRLDRSTLQKNIKVIKEHSLKGTNIVDELLLLAGVRKQEIITVPLDMEKIIHQAEQRLYFLKDKYEGTLLLPDSWPQAIGYGPWVEEVWVNYISNGLKYGGQPPFLKLGATPQADGMIRFWIQDNGPGISAEQQEILFTEFTRLNETRAQGHGLGLSIVRRIIKKLGGTVGINSKMGRGSEFFFTLPTVGKLYGTENFTL